MKAVIRAILPCLLRQNLSRRLMASSCALWAGNGGRLPRYHEHLVMHRDVAHERRTYCCSISVVRLDKDVVGIRASEPGWHGHHRTGRQVVARNWVTSTPDYRCVAAGVGSH